MLAELVRMVEGLVGGRPARNGDAPGGGCMRGRAGGRMRAGTRRGLKRPGSTWERLNSGESPLKRALNDSRLGSMNRTASRLQPPFHAEPGRFSPRLG